MTTPAVPLESVFGRTIMFFVECDGRDVRCYRETLYHLCCTGKSFAGKYHSRFQQRRPADDHWLTAYEWPEHLGFGLVRGNRDDDRRIDSDHIGRPFSS
ncbi:hypothetical protein D3C87_1798890 [compost metagenome]